MYEHGTLDARQIWAVPSSTTTSHKRHCTPFTLPSRGVLTIDGSSIITLTQNAVFRPVCTGGTPSTYHGGPGDPSTVADLRDPFYASTSPQIYAIATATVISYLLVIILFITPRTFFVGGQGGGAGFLGRRGMISGSYGSSSVVGVGRRPWLQKVAALTVAISLTIATSDTFRVAKEQYEMGYMDAAALTDQVVGGLEIRIVRLISGTFLWLAQVQTLIRLFPRHKEKVIIKWTGFALIVLDTIFSILNSFVDQSAKTRPRTFVDAIPALSYLFELALSLLYAAWVIYYSLSKHRYAFFHSKMRNIFLVALLSWSAILVPVVFFVLDISKPNVAGWGDYIRWVGAAAASVVVWEWVERIEALERDERKDGILGREIFDGDEMLEVTPSAEVDWPRQRHRRPGGDGAGSSGHASAWTSASGNSHGHTMPAGGLQHRPNQVPSGGPRGQPVLASGAIQHPSLSIHPTPPPAAASPISRADTSSAGSTVYAVRYHTISSPSPHVPEVHREQGAVVSKITMDTDSSETAPSDNGDANAQSLPIANTSGSQAKSEAKPQPLWRAVPNPFKRQRSSPPPEVATAQANDQSPRGRESSQPTASKDSGWNIKSRLDDFVATQKGKLEALTEGRNVETAPLPVTIIPAQPRGHRSWTPQNVEDPTPQPQNNMDAGATRNRSQQSTLPVTTIPAQPRGQRAWSPQDAGRHPVQPPNGPPPTARNGTQGRNGASNEEEFRSPTDQTASISSSHGGYLRRGGSDAYTPGNLNGQVFSRRGILTISEERRQNPGSQVPSPRPGKAPRYTPPNAEAGPSEPPRFPGDDYPSVAPSAPPAHLFHNEEEDSRRTAPTSASFQDSNDPTFQGEARSTPGDDQPLPTSDGTGDAASGSP